MRPSYLYDGNDLERPSVYWDGALYVHVHLILFSAQCEGTEGAEIS